MKISAINIHPYLYKAQSKVEEKPIQKTFEQSACVKTPFELQKTYALYRPNISFNGKVQKDVNYANTQEFASYLVDRLHKEMNVKTPQDIQKIINNVCKKTKADEKTATQVVARLTQFASYKEFPKMSYSDNDLSFGINLNNVMTYLGKKKEQLQIFADRSEKKFVIFFDNFLLDKIKDQKEEKSSEMYLTFEDMKKLNKEGKLDFAIIDGWNFQHNGKCAANGFLNRQDNIEENAIAVINKMKSENISLDEALNGESIKRIREVFSEDTPVKIIKKNSIKNPSAKSIAKTMAPIIPSEKEICKLFDVAVNSAELSNEDEKNIAKKELAEYLDSMLCCYSPDNISQIMRKKYKQIEKKVKEYGKTMDDVVYVVPNKDKSFSLITYQYALVNNIPQDKIFEFEWGNRYKSLENKVLVILDDIIGSGDSAMYKEFNYHTCCRNFENMNIIYSPIVSLKKGVQKIKSTIYNNNRANKDCIISEDIVDFYKGKYKSFEYYEDGIFSDAIGGIGYDNGAACTIFPYTMPDNNTAFSYLFGTLFLPNKNSQSLEDNAEIIGWDYSVLFKDMLEQITEK